MAPRAFAFRPRFRGLAIGSTAIGASMTALAVAGGFVAVPLITGVLGVGLGVVYLRLPTWRIAVTVDDAGLSVGSPGHERFRLAWTEVVRVVASPTTHTCFVDGGAPARSLLVPGDGAPASYDIADRPALVELILAHVPADKVQLVESLEAARRAAEAAAQPPAAPGPSSDPQT